MKSMRIAGYKDIVGREQGRPCIVVGSAPTMMDFDYSLFHGSVICVGDSWIRSDGRIKPDYWVAANDWFPVPDVPWQLSLINKSGAVFLFADSVTYSNYWDYDADFLDKSLCVEWFGYDQGHLRGKQIRLKGSHPLQSSINGQRPTIQEELAELYGLDATYSQGNTVAIHALAFAIMMGASPIYIQGVEIPEDMADYGYYPSVDADELATRVYKTMVSRIFHVKGFLSCSKTILYGVRNRYFDRFFKSEVNRDIALQDFSYLVRLAAIKNQPIYSLSKTSSLCDVSGIGYMDPAEVIERRDLN